MGRQVAPVADSRLHYRGWLKIGPVDRLEIDLRLIGGEVVLVGAEGALGSWPIEEVEVVRSGGDEFHLSLSGERAVFLVDDVLSFAYAGLPALNAAAKINPLTRALRRWRRGVGPKLGSSAIIVPTPPIHGEKRLAIPTPKVDVGWPAVWALISKVLKTTAAVSWMAAIRAVRLVVSGSKRSVAATTRLTTVTQRAISDGIRANRAGRAKTDAEARPLMLTRGIEYVPADNRTHHAHRFFHQALLGGIMRAVCEECGHVEVLTTHGEAGSQKAES